MKLFKHLVAAVLVAITTITAQGQQLVRCDTSRAYWVLSKDTSVFAIKLEGHVKETEHKGIVAVGVKPLQAKVQDKSLYLKQGEDNTDLKVMVRYATQEAEFLAKQFKNKINIQMQQVPFVVGERPAIVWYYEMPEGSNKQVKAQLFVNVVFADKIVGLSTSQFADQDFDATRDFLVDCISTLRKTSFKEQSQLCTKK